MWNLVGFQTRLRIPEQQRVFRMIPGLESRRVSALRQHPPELLPEQSRRAWARRSPRGTTTGLFFAGQITGVEGYTESLGTGLMAGINLARRLEGLPRRRAAADHDAGRAVPLSPRSRPAPLPADERELRLLDPLPGKVKKDRRRSCWSSGRRQTSVRGCRTQVRKNSVTTSPRRHEEHEDHQGPTVRGSNIQVILCLPSCPSCPSCREVSW